MSCILYSRASYVNLASHPAFQAAYAQTLRSTYDSARAFAEALFELNARAYNDRYSHDDELLTEIEAERESERVDSEFEQFLSEHRYATPRAYAALWELFGRIEYQCSDASNFHELETTWHMNWMRDFCARQMVAAINNYQAPPPVHASCAKLRDELNLISRAADDSPDYDAASIICRAAHRAFALVEKIEGKERKEQQQPARVAA